MTRFLSKAPLPGTSAERRHLLFASAAMLAGCGGGSDTPADPPPGPGPGPSLQVSFEGLQGLKVVRLRGTALGTLAVTNEGLFVRAAQSWQFLGLPGR